MGRGNGERRMGACEEAHRLGSLDTLRFNARADCLPNYCSCYGEQYRILWHDDGLANGCHEGYGCVHSNDPAQREFLAVFPHCPTWHIHCSSRGDDGEELDGKRMRAELAHGLSGGEGGTCLDNDLRALQMAA